jgi:hypothetical protein
METEELEKQLSIWNRLLYAALGSAVTLLFSSLDQFQKIVWFVLQVAVAASGFFLLWGKRWRAVPFSKERRNLIFGFLFASWLLLFVPGLLNTDFFSYFVCISVYTLLLLVIYLRIHKKYSDSDEMFP